MSPLVGSGLQVQDRSPVSAPVRRRGVPWFLITAIGVSTLLRFPGLIWPLSPDEAGFTLVGRSVAPTAGSLYGTYWVDRSPVLVGAYALFADLAGDYGVRVFAAVAGALIVWAAYAIGLELSGRRAARLSTVVVVALLANPDFSAWTGKGEVFGTALVAISAVCSLRAMRAMRAEGAGLLQVRLYGFGAGLTAMLAVCMKQSLLGGFAFGAVLVLGSLLAGRIGTGHAFRYAGHAALGALVPLVGMVAWVLLTPASLDSLWYQVIGFRADATHVLVSGHTAAPSQRARGLWVLATTSWLAPIIVAYLVCLPWLVRRASVEVAALLALLSVDVAGIALGGSYWHAYLIPLLFDAALALGLVAALAGWPRLVCVALVAATCWTSFSALWDFTHSRLNGEVSAVPYNAGLAIRQVADPDETIVSLYGSADVVYASGLASPYQYLWSLPMRTLDPDLTQLEGVLGGPDAPTWIVAPLPINSWEIDADHSLRSVIDERYEVVEDDCGVTIYHLRGVTPAVDLDCHATFTAWHAFR